MMISCKSDADCTASPHGRCASSDQPLSIGDPTICGCVYPCASDAECATGKVCLCAGVVQAPTAWAPTPWASCVSAGCVDGASCSSGECGLSAYDNGCGYEVELACRAPTDACRLDAQCTQLNNNRCVLAGSPTWTCTSSTCAIGRPLLVSGAPRTAPATGRGDWIERGVAPDAGSLETDTREIVVGHWLEAAALEHASVASFARFALELLALGAPAELVAGAQRAGLDEVEHARLSYGVASAYAGRSLGPGPLDLTAVTLRADAREVLRSLVIEGCVGETLGVAEALALRDRASDPALASLHARIASDEQRHAELSWRALAWLLRGAGGDMAELAAACFEEGTVALSADPPARAPAAPEHGVLEAPELGALRRRVLREVVAPCAAALLGAGRPRGDLRELIEARQ
jgi:hypothetical protein